MIATAGRWGAARRASGVMCAWATLLAVAGAASPDVSWRRSPQQGTGGTIHALASDGSVLAAGDDRGAGLTDLARLDASGVALQRVLRRGPVRDLALLPDGALLAATDRGLYRVDADRRVALLRIGAGATQSPVRRVAAVPGLAAVAIEDGVRVSRDTRTWRRLGDGLPRAPTTAVALRARGEKFEVWSAQRGLLWRAETDGGDGPAEAAWRETLPFAQSGEGAEDIALDFQGHDVVIVLPSSLVLRRAPGESWRVLRPALPPGARARRLAFAHDRYWLGTDRGLLEADRLEGPWRRADPPAGTTPIGDLAGPAHLLVAAGREDLLLAAATGLRRKVAPDPRSSAVAPRDPPIQRVHGAALRYLELRPKRIAGIRRGLSRRGWLPQVDLKLAHDTDRSRVRDWDQSYLSGDTRNLFDEKNNRSRDLGLELRLSWDLPRLAFDSEEIDLSRESREVIELRDDVLDEITQLYFERRRVLAELASLDDPSGSQAGTLRLRAAELAAGIDAWTGGWFTRQAAASALSSPDRAEQEVP